MKFNGYNVYFINAVSKKFDHKHYSMDDLIAIGFHEIPRVEDFIIGIFEIYDDMVFAVTSNCGSLLYINPTVLENLKIVINPEENS